MREPGTLNAGCRAGAKIIMEDAKKSETPEVETKIETAPSAPEPRQGLSDKDVAAPGPPVRVPERLRDVDVFFRLLPKLCESFTTRYNDPKTVMALSVEFAREETGRMADIGVCERTVMCYDGRPLALQVYATPPEYRSVVQQPAPAPNQHPQEEGALPLANTNGRGLQGQMVAHFATHSVQKIHGL